MFEMSGMCKILYAYTKEYICAYEFVRIGSGNGMCECG